MVSNHTPDDLELLDVADRLFRARAGLPAPTLGEQALARLMSEVETRRMMPVPTGIKAIIAAMVAGLAGGPAWRSALAAGAAVFVVGGAGLGVAAATGNEPVRELLHISSSSVIGVEFEGVVVDVQPGALRVDANGDLRIVTVDANTEITRSGDDVPFDAIAPSATVEVHGRLLSDNTILAIRVNLEDDAGAPTFAATPSPEPTLAAPATAPAADGDGDDEDGDRDDDDRDEREHDDGNTGPGNFDDDDGDEDNSGPGNDDGANGDGANGDEGGRDNDDGDDDDDDDDRSGSNSGPDGDDEGGDDEDGGSSGSGGDDD